jgi:large subunit ribosomal protein L9
VGGFSPAEKAGFESKSGIVREGTMEVILKEDVANVGKIGEVVRVRDGYARNYLLPRGLVLLANKKNLKTFEHHKKVVADQKQKITREAESVGQSISAVSLIIRMRVGEEGKLFGSVTNIQIEKALKAQGLLVDRRKIQLEEPIKVAGDYEVPIRMTANLTVPLKVSVIPEE